MQFPNGHPTFPIPPAVLDLAQDYFASLGLEELPLSVKQAFAQDVYPRFLQLGENANAKALWEPINTMQVLARASEAFEVWCGGKARTGKTDLILGLAITEHDNSIIFRTETSQVDALEDRSRELLRGTGAVYNASPVTKRWRNIPGNRTLKFGAIKFDKDIDKYYGRPHDLICFDEIAKFKEKHYLSVWGWACTVKEGQRVRIVCTGNPPADSSEIWVKRRWAAWVDDRHPNPARPGELRWFVNLDGKDTEVAGPDTEIHDAKGKKLKPISRTFIPGELLDFYKGTSYEAALDALPEPLRSQLRDGDFSAAEDDQARQVIPTEWVRAAMDRWEGMQQPDVPLRAIGVDVARGGDDQTVICKRWGNYFGELIKHGGKATQTGDAVVELITESLAPGEKPFKIMIDLGGIGSSPFDTLKRLRFNVEGFVGAATSGETDAAGQLEFANRRAEAWWKFREALAPESGQELALPPDPELLADLTAPTWKLEARGIQIEKKEAVSKRLGRSTDCGDAVVMNLNVDVRRGSRIGSGRVIHGRVAMQ